MIENLFLQIIELCGDKEFYHNSYQIICLWNDLFITRMLIVRDNINHRRIENAPHGVFLPSGAFNIAIKTTTK